MTAEQIKELKKGIYQMAVYYNRNLPPEVISMMAEDLCGYDFASILEAFRAYRKDPKNTAFPLPAKIIAMIDPFINDSDPKQEAHEIAQRCFDSITNFGYTKPKEARAFIGPVGWEAINRRGGYTYFCQETLKKDIPILISQMRDAIISDVIRFRQNKNQIVEQIEYKDPPKEIKTERQNEVEFIGEMDPELRKKFIEQFMFELKTRQVGVKK